MASALLRHARADIDTGLPTSKAAVRRQGQRLLHIPIHFRAVLDSVDLDRPLGRIIPIQDSVIGLSKTAQPGEIIGEIVEPMMNHHFGVGSEPF